jgi:hypothetical protein
MTTIEGTRLPSSSGGELVIEDAAYDELGDLFSEWPAAERRLAVSRLTVLSGGRERLTLRLARRGRYLRIRNLATGLLICLYVPGGH